MSFERIAKWIGHSSATITSDTYNRLQEHEIHALVRPLGARKSENVDQEWKALARFLRDPYTNASANTRRHRHATAAVLSESAAELFGLEQTTVLPQQK